MTEFIPSPQEKRDGVIRDHVLGLLQNIHYRLAALEGLAEVDKAKSHEFEELMRWIKREEEQVVSIQKERRPTPPVQAGASLPTIR